MEGDRLTTLLLSSQTFRISSQQFHEEIAEVTEASDDPGKHESMKSCEGEKTTTTTTTTTSITIPPDMNTDR
ncbi:hypothetical protein E2C01_075907 [Portunus trituberculatus]|uniref:Uncharacterized protein n=1 Tax=Portunus trituberculatus TaxID=210409 RepID=A0A5B7I9Z3_PORTR|nr:hypothetical protein [Portunus trituberculatus]